MIDVIAGFEVLGLVARQPDPGQVVADFRTVYAFYQDTKARGLSVATLQKAGTLKAEVGALARLLALADKTLADKNDGPHLETFLASITG